MQTKPVISTAREQDLTVKSERPDPDRADFARYPHLSRAASGARYQVPPNAASVLASTAAQSSPRSSPRTSAIARIVSGTR